MSDFSGQVHPLGAIDLEGIHTLRHAIASQKHLWEKWDALKPNAFGVFNHCVQHIVFKYPVNLNNHRISATFPLWHDWQPLLQPLMDQAVRPYNYQQAAFARVMLAKLLPNSIIPLHIDSSPSAELPHKIHIPLETSPQVVMNFAGDHRHHLPMGQAFEVNNQIEHGVSNPTDNERIHLIFDYFPQTSN